MATSDWKSIDTAPKDGTRILALEGTDRDHIPVVVEWMEEGDEFAGWVFSAEEIASIGTDCTPIFWTEIPSWDFGD